MFGFGSSDDANPSHELIPIKLRDLGGELTQTIDARDLHRGLGVGRDFSNWIKGRIERGQFVEDRDYVVEILDPQNRGTSKPPLFEGTKVAIEYHLALDMAKLVMG
jgi:anti-repressor protein